MHITDVTVNAGGVALEGSIAVPEKAAGIVVSVAAVAGLGVLAWGVMQTEGDDQAQSLSTQVPESPGPGAPAPIAGRSFAYAAPDGTIWLYDLESGQSSPLITPSTDHPPPTGYAAMRAKWSPDGRSIAYHEAFDQAHTGSLSLLEFSTGKAPSIAGDVWNWGWVPASNKVWYDTGERGGVTVYDVAQGTTIELPGQIEAEESAWSPDGRRLVFTQVAERDDRGGALRTDVYVYNLESAEQALIAEGAQGEDPVLGSWSPDGRYYAYWPANRGGSAIAGDMCVFDAIGGEQTCLGGFTSDEFPQWAPTPSTHIFHNYLIRSDPLRAEELFPRPGPVLGWAPDGSKVALVEGRPFGEGPRSVVVLELETMERQTYHTTNADLAHAATPGFYATWSGDSRYLAFAAHESGTEESLSVRVADTESGQVNVLGGPEPRRASFWYNEDSSALLIEEAAEGFSLSIAHPDGSGVRVTAEGAGQVIGPGPWYPAASVSTVALYSIHTAGLLSELKADSEQYGAAPTPSAADRAS